MAYIYRPLLFREAFQHATGTAMRPIRTPCHLRAPEEFRTAERLAVVCLPPARHDSFATRLVRIHNSGAPCTSPRAHEPRSGCFPVHCDVPLTSPKPHLRPRQGAKRIRSGTPVLRNCSAPWKTADDRTVSGATGTPTTAWIASNTRRESVARRLQSRGASGCTMPGPGCMLLSHASGRAKARSLIDNRKITHASDPDVTRDFRNRLVHLDDNLSKQQNRLELQHAGNCQ